MTQVASAVPGNHLDIGVHPLCSDTIFLTDRWGEPRGADGDLEVAESLAETGFERARIEEVVEPLSEAFSTESCFLAHLPSRMSPGEAALFVEFEFAEEWQPADDLHLELDAAEIAAWRACLAFHAPALRHVALALHRVLPEDHAGRMPFLDTSAIYNASIVALLPLDVASNDFWAVHDAMFHNGLPFPPSHHARLGALNELRWRYDPAATPRAALPSTCLSFDGEE